MSLPAVFQEEPTGGVPQLAPEFMPIVGTMDDDLSAGVGGGFAVVSIRASKFRIKYKGNEVPVVDDRGDPVGSIDAVILRANAHITKQFFSKPYEEGDASAPDCFSLDGATPSPAAPMKQATSCAACPKNVFGSAPPRNGVASKAKACQDNRKLAVVPLNDMDNEMFGGPMLFRVPPSALSDLAQFGQAWKARGYPYNAIAVRIGMDINASHPKPTFKAIRPLNSEEAQKVLSMMHSPGVEKILNDFDPIAGEEATQGVQEFPPAQAQAAPTPPPAAKPAPAPQAQAAPAQPTSGATLGKKPAPAPQAASAQTAQAGAGATFGKGKVTQGPATAAPAAAAPAKPKATKKAAAAPAPAPEPVATEPPETVEVVEDPTAGPNADQDIESILAELGSVAG